MERLDDKYHFNLYQTELPICVVVTTRNNAKNYRYEYNLQSILNQKYKNYKLVIVDDASDDGTANLISLFLKKSKLPRSRYVLVRNSQRMTAVPNINNAIKKHCSKESIAVLVSGDDELLGKLVFKVLNVVYQSKQPGVAYTNHFYGKLHDNDFEKGYSRTYSLGEIKNKLYRFIGQKFGHMRTFPVSLFLEIKE
jgi:glycosyltransferase involved in cell wall biosynthesis